VPVLRRVRQVVVERAPSTPGVRSPTEVTLLDHSRPLFTVADATRASLLALIRRVILSVWPICKLRVDAALCRDRVGPKG
jgi:hypothetical protein